MTAYIKPSVAESEVEDVVKAHLGSIATEIMSMDGGNLSSVFSFNHEGKGHVIKFSDLDGAYATERFLSELLSGQGIPYPRCLGQGKHGNLAYVIMERIDGGSLAACTPEQQAGQLPELIGILTRLNQVDIGVTSGYGWIGPDGNGMHPTWKDYLAASFAEDQTGTFWDNWHGLFRSTCLEKDVFDECYSRLIAYAPYNEPHRSFIHGDFHQWNILSSGDRITGIIDGNCAYGDCLVDLAILDRHMETLGVVRAYREFQEKAGIAIPDFNERLLGAYYMKGLDGLRFYAKMGWTDAYNGTRDFLLRLDC
ncbi:MULTISPECIES: aminoglycoside phosphotransferase family protein [unclassified Paenibacillus]|uniref:phosphotransferase family protein n=1 Tax=unclassified Paenibacillus TaxID=185978 RepID=UPI00095535C1|nr:MULTISPECIES: aminoglycoside phosphotransferase family protein [unclassified Paenibacillus]ASS68459.1 aminoglycoside phosphotransferase family protein [Paenibacillus sp. RUD330]SIR34294.1 hygromycin-B 4-O-kinase [Paenibacillus sp. RU4X]SIR45081.1 hygromycin-B 4-O-kinase [Paenibacillus sp. RU4T]